MSVAQRIGTTITQSVSVVVAFVPLAGALLLVRQFPQAVLALDAPATGMWRFDPLALLGCCILAIGTMRPQSLRYGVRLTLAVLGVMTALVVTDSTIQLLALVLASLVIVDRLRESWFVALVAFAVMTFGPRRVAFPPALVVPLTIFAAVAGSGALSWRVRGEAEAVLAPFWTVLLLRSLVLEPWPVVTVVSVTGLGTLLLTVSAWRILRGDTFATRDHMLAVLLVMALVATAQNTILGVVAALWVLTMHGVLLVAGSRRRAVPLGIITIAVGVAAWWSAGAVAAAGGFLGAGAVALVAISASVHALVVARPRHAWILSGALVLALVVAMPWLTTTLALPVAEQLGAGLTAPGLLDAWPWIGTSAMDAGHRRVTLLPGSVLLCLFVVAWAVAWLIGRVRGFAPCSSVALVDADVMERIRARVWWLR